jgi:alginate production protein
MSNRYSIGVAMLVGACVAPLVYAVEVDYKFKGTAAGVFDGGRDFGLLGANDNQHGYLDVSPWIHWQFSPSWGAFLRVHGYAASGAVLPPGNDSNNTGVNDDAYVGLKEAWIEYGGLTSYPGEWLRLGRQRIRQDDGQWWDQDIDALRWVFDTTLLKMDMGVARQFDPYRTDNIDVPVEQRDRTYIFGSLGGEWLSKQGIGVRVVHASDDNKLPEEGSTAVLDDKFSRSQLTWLGVTADNHFFDWRYPQPLSYWLSGTALFGKERRRPVDELGVVGPTESENVSGWAAEGIARWRLARAFPLQLGGGLTVSTGASDSDRGHQYVQTGVQSNYSRFTGTRSLIYRYNEAFRPELGNLQAVTGFASVDVGRYDASAIFNMLMRTEGDGPITANGVVVDPVTGSRRLGEGLDLVLSRYFSVDRDLPTDESGEATSSAIRLRTSVFNPGKAYGPDAELDYRAVVELTLWY